eukprot:3311953-Pleurochrysis_carterae.AAC.7
MYSCRAISLDTDINEFLPISYMHTAFTCADETTLLSRAGSFRRSRCFPAGEPYCSPGQIYISLRATGRPLHRPPVRGPPDRQQAAEGA